jgi:hypothetical protein
MRHVAHPLFSPQEPPVADFYRSYGYYRSLAVSDPGIALGCTTVPGGSDFRQIIFSRGALETAKWYVGKFPTTPFWDNFPVAIMKMTIDADSHSAPDCP